MHAAANATFSPQFSFVVTGPATGENFAAGTSPAILFHLAQEWEWDDFLASGPLDHTITLCFGTSNKDNRPQAKPHTIRELQARWSRPDTTRGTLTSAAYHALDKADPDQKRQRNAEKDGEYFCAAEFAGDGRRCDENVASLSGFTLDFDSGRTTREVIQDKLRGLTYVAYTSYSHQPGNERWRVFIPYANPIAKERHRDVYGHFQDIFSGDLDQSCSKPSQLYYTPACPLDAVVDFECLSEEGALFDPAFLPERARSEPVVPPAAPDHNSATPSVELDRIKSALTFLDPDSRDQWIDVGMAMKRDFAELGMAPWIVWSQRSPKFDLSDAVETWQTFKPKPGVEGITLASIFHRAQGAGWMPTLSLQTPTEIAELNQQYFVAIYGRKVSVFRENVDVSTGEIRVEPFHVADFRTWFMNRSVNVPTKDGGTKSVPLADHWLKHPARRQFEGVVFAPGKDLPGHYNLWRGFAVQPKPGDWRLMRKHLLFVICRGDRRLYRYLLNWMANAVQNPGHPAEVAVVLRGGRGAGKGMLARSFGQLFGQHFRHIAQARHLTGNFNAHLENCVVLFVDEGYWAGDKQGEGVLKSLVTEPTLTIERKGFDSVQVANCLHIVVASNNEWVVPAGPDERRFFVLDVDDSRNQEQAYFDPLYKETDHGGKEAMLHDLQRRDLTHFNIRKVPQTKALAEQKQQSMDPHHKWFFEKLVAGDLMSGKQVNLFPAWGPVTKAALHDDYVESVKIIGASRRSTETELGTFLKKMLPPGFPKTSKPWNSALNRQAPTWEFPPLDDCRKQFEKLHKLEGKIDWETGEVKD
jgi:Family of unknown function (DUF5906)/Primase C terminal 2 (PriCT-2)